MSQSITSPPARRTAARNPLQTSNSPATFSNYGISKPSWPSGRKQACFSCRQRKKKCDGSTPTCGLCSRTGNACFYSMPVIPTNLYHNGTHYMELTPSDSSSVGDGHNDSSNNRAHGSHREPLSPVSSNGQFSNQNAGTITTMFEDAYQPVSNIDLTQQNSIGETPTFLTDDTSNQSFWGDLNSFSLFPSINFGMDSIMGPLTPNIGQNAIPTPPYSASENTLPSTSSDTPIPSPDQFNMLLDTFISHCHSLLPCLHLKRLRERTANGFHEFQSSPLFWIIAASGAWHHRDNTEIPQGEAWLQKACNLIDERIISVKKPLETLQALVYVVYQSYVSAAMVQMWVQLGNACRLTSMIGWDKIDGKSQPSPYAPRVSSLEEKEEQRRVVWNLFVLDRAMSCMAGWSLGVDDRHFMVKYPVPESRFQLSDLSVSSDPYSMDLTKLICSDHNRHEHKSDGMGLLFRAHALLGRILTYHNNLHEERLQGHHSAEFGELESALTKFHLLIYGSGSRSLNSPAEERVKEVWLYILIQTCTILLYHPTVEDSPSGSPFSTAASLPGFERCVNAMRNMVNKIKEGAMYNTESLLNPFLLPAYFLTCRFLILIWHETKDAGDRNSIDVILMLIDRTADLWGPLATKYRRTIMADLARNPDDMRQLRRGTGSYLSRECRS